MNRIVLLFIGALSTIQLACNNADTATQPVTNEKMKIEDQGVNIAYDDTQKGDTTILFIHGWAINRTYWEDQVKFFAPRYRVVTVDLPGFGESGKNRKNWTVGDYAKDMTTVMIALDLKNVILVGHSMSGAVIVETALENPTKVIGIVGVDNFKNYGYVQTPKDKEEAANIYKTIKAQYKESVSQYVNQALVSPSTDSVDRKRILHDMTTADSTIVVDILEQADSFPLDARLDSLKKKLYLINSHFTPTDTPSLRKGNIDFALYDIGPTGHYPMIEKPDEFNQYLQQIIDRIR